MKNRIKKFLDNLMIVLLALVPIVILTILYVFIKEMIVTLEDTASVCEILSEILITGWPLFLMIILEIGLCIYNIYIIVQTKNTEMSFTKLSKELKYFKIEKDKKAVENDIKNYFGKDTKIARFSKEHYAFLYNSLSKHICRLDRLMQIPFLNERIYNSELCSDGAHLDNLWRLISFFLTVFFGSDILTNGNVSLVRAVAYLIIIAIITAFFRIYHSSDVKPKHAFYLSVLNQLKEDLR